MSKNSDDKANNDSPSSMTTTRTARKTIGNIMIGVSDGINDNIIAARYGVFASITLLTAFGISRSPLFFRYRTVLEIPRSYFIKRNRVFCRIIGVRRSCGGNNNNNNNNFGINKTNSSKRLMIENPIEISVLLRHLSPFGMLLSTSWFEFFMKINPSSTIKRDSDKLEGNTDELLRVQIAGIQQPPIVSQETCNPEQFLEKLAKKRTLVSCQFIGREVENPSNLDDNSDQTATAAAAICRIKYRPHWLQFYGTDIAEVLVKRGEATVASNILARDSFTSTNIKVVDSSQRIQDIRKDIQYIDKLSMVEFKAAQTQRGMWSIREVREMNKDIIEEASFQSKANLIQKIWRRMRGG